jgi:2-polyprenyl-3-methyl-5-hydroxy-6-metoxy-1,4-benzoquinol methylase
MMSSKENVRKRFSERAREWATSYSDPEPRSLNVKNLMARQRFVLQMVEAGLPRGSKILDVGCGPGEIAAKLMQRGYDVWGVDIAEPMIRYARERCGVNQFQVGDIEQIPFRDGTFDGVVCVGVLEYLDGDSGALREIERVLKPGGRAVLSMPNAVCVWYHLDRAVVAAEALYGFAKDRLRGKPVPTRPARTGVALRTYRRRRGRWLRLLRSMGLEPEEWLCYGWGWYNSRLGTLVELVSRSAPRFRATLELFLGRALVHRAGDSLARSRTFNWMACEQLVRLRVEK